MTRDEKWLLKEKYHGTMSDAFRADCERLKAGEPLAYLIGHAPFLNTTIGLDSRPLIPRPETEYWVHEALEEIGDASYVLDLCAGSGCIGISVLKKLPHTQVDFAEINPAHHETIRKNIVGNDLDPKQSRIYGGDLFERIPRSNSYDAILSNPPYIDPAYDRTEAGVRIFEPPDALYGGRKGTDIIERIIRNAPHYLTPAGVLYIEHEPEQAQLIEQLGHQLGFDVQTRNDQYNLLRYTRLARP